MHVFVTGGAGFIGSNLIAELCAQGHRVSGLDTYAAGVIARGRANKLRAEHGVVLDERDAHDIKASIAALAERPDAIVHLAGPISVPESMTNPEKYCKDITDATACVLEAARAHGIKRVVFASTAAVYGNPATMPVSEQTPIDCLSPYAEEKYNAEGLLRVAASEHGTESVILRFFNVYGQGQDPTSAYSGVVSKFIERVASGLPPMMYGDGLQTRDFVHVSDAVAAIIAGLTRNVRPGLTVNIGSGKATSVVELARAVVRLGGTALKPESVPAREGDVRHSVADIGLAGEELGYVPQTALDEGLRQTWAWFQGRRR
jgi:UDP-glucose 4-epimerase